MKYTFFCLYFFHLVDMFSANFAQRLVIFNTLFEKIIHEINFELKIEQLRKSSGGLLDDLHNKHC